MTTRNSRGPRRALETSMLDGRGAIERLSRLAGGSTFREPALGRASRSLSVGAEDLSYALRYITDPLMQCLALALSCQTAAEWPKIQELAAPIILVDLRNNPTMRGLVEDHRKYRVRLVLHDVFHDMALVRPSRPWKEAAAGVRMNESAYRALYEWIAGFLETQAGEGAMQAIKAL